MLLGFEKQPSVVYLEHRGNSAFLEEPEHVAEAKESLRWLRNLALSQDDSVKFIARVADELADYQGARSGDRGPFPCHVAQEQSYGQPPELR